MNTMYHHLLLSLFACFSFAFLHAQRNLPVYWEYTNGKRDSSLLVDFPTKIKEENRLLFRDLKNGNRLKSLESEFNLREIEWLVHQKDTLIRGLWYNGDNYSGQLLYQGEVQLYRVIGKEKSTYFIHYNDQVYPLTKENVRDVGYRIIRSNCQYFRPSTRMWGDLVAMEIVRQLNQCLGNKEAYAIHNIQPIRFRASAGVDFGREDKANNTIGLRGYSADKRFALHMPRAALVLDYAPFRKFPWLYGQLQIRSRNFAVHRSYYYNSPSGQGTEIFRMNNLYLYPGMNLEMAQRWSVQPFLGGGASIVFPLNFQRIIHFSNPNTTVSGLPVYQEFRGGQRVSTGHYLQMGVRIRWFKQYSLALAYRKERLVQSFEGYGKKILSSAVLPTGNRDLAPAELRFVQIQFAYNW